MHHKFTVVTFLQVVDKGPPLVGPKPKPRHISVPTVPVSETPEVTSPRHHSLCPPRPPIHSTRGHYHSMPDSLDVLQPKERRQMRVSNYNCVDS